MQILTNKILKVISENINNENFYKLPKAEIVISFNACNKQLKEQEIFKMNNNKDLAFIRGYVEVKQLIDNDFGFANWKVYFKENNVSFKRFSEMMENLLVNEFDNILEDNYNLDLFFSY